MHDPVFQSFQRLLKKPTSLFLAEDSVDRRKIERVALRRFLAGYPPRKKDDTSIGDSINWEWMISCCKKESANLVIVSRDSDFGCTLNGKSYVNDWLKNEYHSRLSRHHTIQLFDTLADGLRLFGVSAGKEVKKDEQAAALKASDSDTAATAAKVVQRILDAPPGSSREIIESMIKDETGA